ncbi:MAG: DMT family protein [Bacteroidales bacterium]|nr:DMT family protein [Bacteroidales bacterium]
MRGVYTVLLLIVSNIFMTFAWYGNLKLSDMGIIKDWPLILIILASWGVALLEYTAMVPANRIGSEVHGGPFSLVELKVIQEVVSLIVFMFISIKVFKMGEFQWNHLVGFGFLVLAVYFIFKK